MSNMPGGNGYNLLSQDSTQHDPEENTEGAVGASQIHLASIVESMNALTNAVSELRVATEESQRDIERLRSNIEREAQQVPQPHLVEATRQSSPVSLPERPTQDTVLASNESVTKLYDLPSFSGNSDEWPLFLANFKDTTQAFRYSNRQNLMRLHKCLVGRAKETVASMLIYPNDVPNAIAELECHFGRPAILVRSQISKVQQFPSISENKVDQIIAFSTKTRNIVGFLTSAKCEHHLSNTTLLEQLVMKLPPSKQYEWTRQAINIRPYATVNEFSLWLSELARVVCLIPPLNTTTRSHQPVPQQQSSRRIMHVGREKQVERGQGIKCYVCEGSHVISSCESFKNMSVHDRWEKVKGESQPVLNCRDVDRESGQFFKYVPVTLMGPNSSVDVFAMVDEGSAVSSIEDNVAKRLGLKRRRQPLTLQWYGENCTTEESSKVNLEIRGKNSASTYNIRNVCTLRSLDLPAQSFSKADFAHLEFLPLENYSRVKPSLLLGLDNTSLSVPSTTVQASENSHVPIKTKLGLIAYVPTSSPPQTPVVLHILERKGLTSLNALVTEYFAADNFGIGESINQIESEEDQIARQMLHNNTRRLGKRFESGLLWRNLPPALPDSCDMAYKRLLGIERKMQADSRFAAKYKEEIDKYLRMGYARKLSDEEVRMNFKFNFFLPHFAVNNPHKPEKMGVVFDTAALVNGVSLNSCLLKGPEHAKPLLTILFKLREGAVAVAADIREMFSQVIINKRDQQAQRFLWRDGNANQPVEHFVMQSMVFGAMCSPCIAEFVKNKNAEDFRQQYPEAATAIVESHYVDDFVASFKNEQDAERICNDIVYIHSEGGFQLRGFVSNVKRLQDSLNAEPHMPQSISLENGVSYEKALGMRWNTMTDSFEFMLNFHRVSKAVLEGDRAPTKRELLSIVMSVFDPFGIIADFLLFAKMLVQEVWRHSIGWDEAIPSSLHHKWFMWWSELNHVNIVKVKRWYSPQLQSTTSIQLHIVVDASQSAFAAAVYFRITSSDGCDVTFVAGKTKGALQKLLSVPILELQAAVLGVRKMKRVMAWVLRAADIFLKLHITYQTCDGGGLQSELSAAELNKAEIYIVKAVQREVYAEEISALLKDEQLHKQSSIRSLTPYLDNDQIMRIQGRLDAATVLPVEARRPILMPSKHIVSELIMRQYHERLHHQNFALTLYEARQKFWFTHAKSLLKSVQRTCLTCHIDRAKPAAPLMGQLPEDRVTPYVKPFSNTGVDLFGPFNVTVGRRREKRWAVIFTCLIRRAAHLELAHDLSTNAFLLCLRNFINRRGTPIRIRSDNGTNFVGAQRELKEADRMLNFERISDEVTSRNIDWKFNCPSNPSSGGCWERLIGVVKRMLLKTLHEEAPKEDTLRSVLIEAENILNSRPLTDVPLSSEEDDPITPNHFLVGCPNSMQTAQPADQNICLRKQWRIPQNLKDRIWKQWVRHYLPQLLVRPKWQDKVKPIAINDLVLVCDDLQPRSQWKKGRVTKVFPAKDKQIRLVEIKTANGVLRRPVSRLAILRINGESLRDSRWGGV
ncbi:uncharacterized protein [Eurosta solidaginis]|uniref:uncharacterized protein n=1 Tax=Eurosta solidaginis TaxID=178769 RepID=UPI0035308159